MRHMVNGRIVEVRTGPGGAVNTEAIRRAAGISPDRQLILQLPDGGNRILNPGENVSLPASSYFTEAPGHRRG